MKYNFNKIGTTALAIGLGLMCSFNAMAQKITFASEVKNLEIKLDFPEPPLFFGEKPMRLPLKYNKPNSGNTFEYIIEHKSDAAITVAARDLVIFAYTTAPGEMVNLTFFKNKDGVLDYRFGADDVINNFSKQFHQKVMPLLKGNISEELIEKTRKAQRAIYDKIAPKLNKTKQLAARYMMEGRLLSLEMKKAQQQRDMDFFKKPHQFPKGFIKLYPYNFYTASKLFESYLKVGLGLDETKIDNKTKIEKAVAYTDNQTFLDMICIKLGKEEIKKGDKGHKKKFLAYLKSVGISDMAYEELAGIKHGF